MDALDVAFAGVLTTFLLGVVGSVVALLSGRADRRHGRLLAQDERLFAKRSAAYEAMLAQAHREMAAMARTYPLLVIGKPLDLPEPLSEDEWLRLRASVEAFGSHRVRAAGDAYREKVLSFFAQAQMYAAMERQGARRTARSSHRVEARTRRGARPSRRTRGGGSRRASLGRAT